MRALFALSDAVGATHADLPAPSPPPLSRELVSVRTGYRPPPRRSGSPPDRDTLGSRPRTLLYDQHHIYWP